MGKGREEEGWTSVEGIIWILDEGTGDIICGITCFYNNERMMITTYRYYRLYFGFNNWYFNNFLLHSIIYILFNKNERITINLWKRSSNNCILYFLMRRNFISSSARITRSHYTCWTTSKQQVKFLLSLINKLLLILPTTATRTLNLPIFQQQKVKSTFVVLIDFQLYDPYVFLLLSLKEYKHHYVKNDKRVNTC